MIKMDEKFNWARVVIGGVVAGVAMNVINGIVNLPILSEQYEELRDQGIYESVPRHPAIEFNLVGLIALGIVMTFVYAVARHRMGPGPRTAIVVGLALSFVAVGPSSLNQAAWDPAPYLGYIWRWWLLGGFVQTIVGSFLGAVIYTEDDEE